jgi:hypothetical protein
MAENVIILSSGPAQTSEQNLAKIARHLGVPFSFGERAGLQGVVVTTWQTLQESASSPGSLAGLLAKVKALFVYGWNETESSNQFLKALTAGAVCRAKADVRPGRRMSVAPGSRDFAHQLEGQDFAGGSGSGCVTFVLAEGAQGVRPIVSRDLEPVCIALNVGGTQMVLSGAAEIADLDSPAGRDSSLLERFETFVPVMMFIRKHFGTRCWNPEKTRGCVLIDDPLLRPNYGYVNFGKLLQTLQRQNCSASVAFIPWNYRRTHPPVAALFNSHPGRLSLCVHGCDHTRREFCTADAQRLRHLIRSALWRMEQHERLFGVKFDPVMVFPQGFFSTQAMNELAQSRFLAAINSTPFPADRPEGILTLKDLLEPAITQFGNFPLLIRRYPKNPAEFALDLFLGKPLLIVEHHDYFRDGYEDMEGFVAKLNALDSRLHWASPATICSGLCLQRANEAGGLDVRFYTDYFLWTNHEDQPQNCNFFRRAAPGGAVKAVKVNGQPSDWVFEGDYVKITAQLAAGQRAEVTVERVTPLPAPQTYREGLLGKTKVFFRRHLCEFRDNFVDKSPVARRSYQYVRKLVQTAPSSQGGCDE